MPSHPVRQFVELRKALADRGETERGFALRKQIDKSTFNRLLNGNITQLDLDLMNKVADGTGGVINHETFAAFAKRLAENPPAAKKRKRRRVA